MRLVKIYHIRCSEWDGSTYAWFPEDWSIDQISEAVYDAQTSCFRARQEAKEVAGQEPPYVGYPNFNTAPRDKTAGELMDEYEVKKAAYTEWHAKVNAATKPFISYLLPPVKPLWDESELVNVDCDWGHHHGDVFNYQESPGDYKPFKKPETKNEKD